MLPSLFATLGGVLLVDTLRRHRQLRRALDRPPPVLPPASHRPSVTVIRPIRGCDIEARENLRAALRTGYPGEVETLFVLDDETDPAVPLIRAAVAEHRASGANDRVEILFAGHPPPGRTGKLNAMIYALAHARGELIAFGDSDTRPDERVLTALVDALLADPGAGSAFAPVVVPGVPRTLGDTGYALFVNALYGPAIARLATARPVPFIMGQLMVFRREALDAVGGLACAEGQLVDDMHIGACLHAAGYRNLFVRVPLPIITRNMPLASFGENVRRWVLQSRTGLPREFVRPMWITGVAFYVALILAVALTLAGHPLAALPAAATLFAIGWSLDALQRAFGGGPIPLRHRWLPFAIYLLTPPLFFSAQRRKHVHWRGRAYPVSRERRLGYHPVPSTP